jgi:hypothetical protein
MRWWRPSPDEPELFDWWRPLLAFSRRAREERVPWPVHVGEFELCGRVERGTRPAIWIYEHRANRGELLVDWHGRAYDFIRYRTGRQLGRFREIGVRRAVWRAALPDVVEPVWYEDEHRPRRAAEPIEPPAWVSAAPAPLRRRHLYVVPQPTNLN